MHRKKIPSSGEPLPVIGCGTWQGFDVSADSAEYERLREVLRALFDAGGSVVDSSPMYGRAEDIAGRLLAQAGTRERAFVATKVWTSGREAGIRQMEESFRLLKLNYSIDDRAADERILPLAAERGVAVLVNRPFGGGGLLRSLRDRPLPGWAGDIGCESWAQALLKFVVSHPSVSCAIPGTGNPAHMRANASAGTGAMPDAAMRRRMVADGGF